MRMFTVLIRGKRLEGPVLFRVKVEARTIHQAVAQIRAKYGFSFSIRHEDVIES